MASIRSTTHTGPKRRAAGTAERAEDQDGVRSPWAKTPENLGRLRNEAGAQIVAARLVAMLEARPRLKVTVRFSFAEDASSHRAMEQHETLVTLTRSGAARLLAVPGGGYEAKLASAGLIGYLARIPGIECIDLPPPPRQTGAPQ